jgi:tRNA pseudouridine38-40 synthase
MWGASSQDARRAAPDSILLIPKGQAATFSATLAAYRLLILEYARRLAFVPSPAAGRDSGWPGSGRDEKLSISEPGQEIPTTRPSITLLAILIPMAEPAFDAIGAPASSQNWKLTLAYDGADFKGWQIQPGEPTIQGELQAALGRVTGEAPLPQGSGRTDAGVHALAQVASFRLQARIPAENLARALNRTLPASIRVLDACTAPGSFHARHSAVAKIYEYRVFVRRPVPERPVLARPADDNGSGTPALCSPFLARYVYACPWLLSLENLQDAARQFLGEHDFTSFAATDPDLATRTREPGTNDEPPTAIRTILSSNWERGSMDGSSLLVYRVRGNGFLHHMVRNLVGTMVDVGRGFTPYADIPAILAARNRAAAGPTAPASGLFLHSVEYAGVDLDF